MTMNLRIIVFGFLISAFQVIVALKPQRTNVNLIFYKDGSVAVDSELDILPHSVRLLNNRSAAWFSTERCPMMSFNYKHDNIDFSSIKVLNVGFENTSLITDKIYAVSNKSNHNQVFYLEFPKNYEDYFYGYSVPSVLWIYTRPEFKIKADKLTKDEVIECLEVFKLSRLAEQEVGLTKNGQPKKNKIAYTSVTRYKSWLQTNIIQSSEFDTVLVLDELPKHQYERMIIGTEPTTYQQVHNESAAASTTTTHHSWIYIAVYICSAILSTSMLLIAAYIRVRKHFNLKKSSSDRKNFIADEENPYDIHFSSPITSQPRISYKSQVYEAVKSQNNESDYMPMTLKQPAITKQPLPEIPTDGELYERPITVIEKKDQTITVNKTIESNYKSLPSPRPLTKYLHSGIDTVNFQKDSNV